ncbi:Oxidoreductase [Fusarium irregulare]|uniref:Mitochondrial intermembrane space import and assembly protein 40 n=1 Tax=Fusarium irregulare TaxID=2494466 RepID=A0A9W8U4C6_9HYPO|nr:Oxidoreductase [Fusarium irregulare]KAJ4005658.1 Oxidoreductase [Fusarium irregulare]
MYRNTMRSATRPVIASLRSSTLRAAPRRFASTAPADKPRTLKGSLARLGLAFGAVYYYNTSPIFADEALSKTVPAPAAFSDDDLPTVDSIVEEKRKQIKAKSENSPKTPEPQQSNNQAAATDGSPAALEEEAGQQGAFNPETGEINWDCPCLGGMAHGPCGEEFKTAFSCFVFSEEEPKGMDCIEKFQGMQECFKKYPEIYGAELADDEEGAPTPDFGDEQPSGAPTTAEFKSDGAPAREFGEKAAADTTKDSQKTAADNTHATDFKKLPEDSSAAAEPDRQAPPRYTSSEAESQSIASGSRMVQDVATPIEEPVNQKYWQDMHETKVPKKDVAVEPVQAHDATAANEEIKVIEKQKKQ